MGYLSRVLDGAVHQAESFFPRLPFDAFLPKLRADLEAARCLGAEQPVQAEGKRQARHPGNTDWLARKRQDIGNLSTGTSGVK